MALTRLGDSVRVREDSRGTSSSGLENLTASYKQRNKMNKRTDFAVFAGVGEDGAVVGTCACVVGAVGVLSARTAFTRGQRARVRCRVTGQK